MGQNAAVGEVDMEVRKQRFKLDFQMSPDAKWTSVGCDLNPLISFCA